MSAADNVYYDALETRSPEVREATLMQALSAQVAHAKTHAPAYAALLKAFDAAAVNSRAALAQLPVTRKSELKAAQALRLPFGGYAAKQPNGMAKLFQSPGPIYEPEGRGENFWRSARAFYAAGLRAGDIVHNSFSYHLTPAGSMMESGALALGCTVIPAGVGQTEQQLQAIHDLKPSAYIGTPSFLRILLEKAVEAKADVSSIKRAVVSGEALPPSLRQWFAERGVSVAQLFGTADLGTLAYESVNADNTVNPGMLLDESIILELVYPGTGTPLANSQSGEVGELLITTLSGDYPLLRFSTGDLTAIMPGASPCGRTNTRIKGWMGRADQTTKIRGMFVHAAQVHEVMKAHPEVSHVRLVVSGEMANDAMTLKCESLQANSMLAQAVAETLRSITKLRGEIEWLAPNTLPRDGKVIEDARSYQ
jgi:phenylacetate-CoA ligase